MEPKLVIIKKIAQYFYEEEVDYDDKYLKKDKLYQFLVHHEDKAILKLLIQPLLNDDGQWGYKAKAILRIIKINEFERDSGSMDCVVGSFNDDVGLYLLNIDISKFLKSRGSMLLKLQEENDKDVIQVVKKLIRFFKYTDNFYNKLLHEISNEASDLEWKDPYLFQGYLCYMLGMEDLATRQMYKHFETESARLTRVFSGFPEVLSEEIGIEKCKLEKRLEFIQPPKKQWGQTRLKSDPS